MTALTDAERARIYAALNDETIRASYLEVICADVCAEVNVILTARTAALEAERDDLRERAAAHCEERDAALAEAGELRLDRAEFADRNEALRGRIDRAVEFEHARIAEAVAAVTPRSCSAQRTRAERAEAEADECAGRGAV